MYCEVCGVSLENDDGGVLITERTSTSNVKLVFKLYSVLDNSDLSLSGVICQSCHDLCEKMDLLESQLKEVQMNLKERSASFFLHQHHEAKICIEEEELPAACNDSNGSDSGENHDQLLKDQDQVDSSLGSVDTDFSITKTQRKEDSLLLYKGYTFRRLTTFSSSSEADDGRRLLARWRCANNHFKTNPCHSQAVTTIDNTLLLLDFYTDHNHDPNFSKCHRTVLRERIKTIVLNHPNMKTAEILTLAAMLDGNSKRLKDDKSLHRYVQRIRAKHKSNHSTY